jgi:predicted CXXCH cytochrome family protein
MRILSLLIISLALFFYSRQTDSPHGAGFKISCKTCHSPNGWQLDKAIYSFDHNTTKLPLTGQHIVVGCRQCHPTLNFAEAKTNCSECHNDIHQATVGLDCSRCHTPASWLVNNITELHQISRFPLIGAHRTADCFQCHKSESKTRFDVPGVNCIDCHRQNFMATTKPNHIQAGFSEDCSICHHLNTFRWDGAGFNHAKFPLIQGHSNVNCVDCHKTPVYAGTSTDCYSCHQTNYAAATNPNHIAANFPQNCATCHTLSPGWKPAVFNHTIFPLTLGHTTPACADCHIGGNYTSTPTDCYSCHQANYTATTNPNHIAAGFPQACGTCHTLAPGWKPATFNHTSFPLTLGHAVPTCTDCHKGNYTNTPTDCYVCHQADYTGATNPNHVTLNFATLCTQCHTTNPGWKPASYTQHDTQFFPIFSGRHKGQWNSCTDCHTNPANYASFVCITCHSNVHPGSNYTNAQCYSCHPRGVTD